MDHIGAFVEEGDFEGFLGSELIRSAVVQKLAIIGKAAARISQEVKGRHPQVPWPKIVAFRDILVHAYFGIDWDEVWQAARFRCPVPRAQVADILTTEFGGPEDAGLR